MVEESFSDSSTVTTSSTSRDNAFILMNPNHYSSIRRSLSNPSNNEADDVIPDAEPVRPWLDEICFPRPIYYVIHLLLILFVMSVGLSFYIFRYHEAYESFFA